MILPCVVLPLRIPVDADLDLLGPLREWLDWCQATREEKAAEGEDFDDGDLPDLTTDECHQDIVRLQGMRTQMAQVLQQPQMDHEKLLEHRGVLQEYAAALLSFLQQQFLLPVTAEDPDVSTDGSFQSPLCLRWKTQSKVEEGSKPAEIDVYGSLEYERGNILWNLCTLEAYQATKSNFAQRQGWVKSSGHLSLAAQVLRMLRAEELYPEEIAEDDDNQNNIVKESNTLAAPPLPWAGVALQQNTLLLWETLLLAEAHRASYETMRTMSRPRHFMLASFAATAKPIYQRVQTLLQQSPLTDLQFLTPSPTASDTILTQRLDEWNIVSKAWTLWMSAKASYHQAVEHHEKSEWGLELARIDAALEDAEFCQALLAGQTPASMGIDFKLVEDMRQRQIEAEEENSGRVPEREELPPIPPKESVKMNQSLTEILPELKEPFFTSVMDDMTREYAQKFRQDVEDMVEQAAQMGDEKTEKGRKALATVNLPHSLTAYQQEINGGGIPDDLWARVDLIQRDKRDDRVKHELWELQDLAETARNTYKKLVSQLQEDKDMDSLFREQHDGFNGPDVEEIQKAIRVTLQKYDRLIGAADESDALLVRRCETLERDPKFRLLKLSKNQLDRLLPAVNAATEIDVSSLNNYLGQLSELFTERESLILSFREKVKTFSIVQELQSIAAQIPDEQQRLAEYDKAAGRAKASFTQNLHSMHDSIRQQDQLLTQILKENERFMHARRGRVAASATNKNDAFIANMNDALEEIDQFGEHLKEGRNFYDMIIPKLDRLRQQVEDVSARLTVERCEFEEQVSRNRQEAEDARFAASMGPPANTGAPGPDGVEDGKVASLVAMDFEPDKVVAALKNHDNNLDHALNELLGA